MVLPFDAAIAPDRPAYIIGDVHGCLDLLSQKLDLISQEKQRRPEMRDAAVVLLGDLVDRGPKSAQVLALAHQLCTDTPDDVVCIKGNHEAMLLDFIDDPAGRGRRWLRFGGADTLASYGFDRIDDGADLEDLVDASGAFEKALGQERHDWLRDLPTCWSTGNVHCVHAGMDPERPVHQQKNRVMVWGHSAFDQVVRTDDQWVVHGHTIVPKPQCHSGRIATDTGAYKTGTLTAAAISAEGVRFI
ncbi:metallophosphoesterase family protein [Nereida sp. MMG025]|uniref:metallophosphoesterase family protein n=1 Tax=Nereida sp. MMG025 TaxID=2909981 RepID=UPI001F15D555|nr:metallophosphoesterase family protein [Nereida sp. MMG025]MCF6445735.1 serine/threonine protein phosphatase [Nereida sp. MMG025]